MNDQEFDSLCDELGKAVELGPGVNDRALRRVRAIVFAIRNDATLTGYIKEKAIEAEADFSSWFSARKWRKHGDGVRLRSMLFADIFKCAAVSGARVSQLISYKGRSKCCSLRHASSESVRIVTTQRTLPSPT